MHKKKSQAAGGGSARRPAEMATADLLKDSKPPLTLCPNFNCKKGSVTADKPPVCPAGGLRRVAADLTPQFQE